MALTDDLHPRKKAKLEEQMATVQAEINKLKAKLSKNISTPPQSNICQSPVDRSEGSMRGLGKFLFVITGIVSNKT